MGGCMPENNAGKINHHSHLDMWGKFTADPFTYHPLLYHLIDTASVGRVLWQDGLYKGIKSHFSKLLNFTYKETENLLSFLIGLHDIGKAGPAFQAKCPIMKLRLAERGFKFPSGFMFKPLPHGLISGMVLENELPQHISMTLEEASLIARSLAGHHGSWPALGEMQSNLKKINLGDPIWYDARTNLINSMMQICQPPKHFSLPINTHDRNALITLLSGICVLADWVGSIENYFPYSHSISSMDDYIEISGKRARDAILKLGWGCWAPSGEVVPFNTMFKFKPNQMQEHVIAHTDNIQHPALVILEAPTGCGKTEAAFYMVDHWLQKNEGQGFYIAMPTQATSNQMFTRTETFLSNRYPQHLLNLHLVHGSAIRSTSMKLIQLKNVGESIMDGVHALSWFLPRKRTLLAPFGVGTVDQVFLSIMQTKHFFLRLFGLSSKVIIFDEVHAYDTYMNTLFLRLLSWLKFLNTTVILLSATLPDRTKRDLIQVYSKCSYNNNDLSGYPCLTVATNNSITQMEIQHEQSVSSNISWLKDEEASLLSSLERSLQEGGCAAVICNTVQKAQEMYQWIKKTDIVPSNDLILFHARFPYQWRQQIEKEVLIRFSKDGQRPKRSIVVATQVIEQSLDLDFDVMFSELAPVDLIIQRIGRLHRHPKRIRPEACKDPKMFIFEPQINNGNYSFGNNIYEPYILLRSYLVLSKQGRLILPEQTRTLIEMVYGDLIPPDMTNEIKEVLREYQSKMETNIKKEHFEAWKRIIPSPESENLLGQDNLGLVEENPEFHPALQAMTRLGGPCVSVVCMQNIKGNISPITDINQTEIMLDKTPTEDEIELLLDSTINVQHRGIVNALTTNGAPTAWDKTAVLRNHYPIIFIDGVCKLERSKYMLCVDNQLGLSIKKEET